MNKSSVPGEHCTSDERTAYKLDRYGRTPEQVELYRAQASPEPKVKTPFQTAIDSTFVRRSEMELLQRRVAHLEARMDHMEQWKNEDAWKVCPVCLAYDCQCEKASPLRPMHHADDSSREYYEQQIEEISAKWQAAEEKLLTMGTQHSCDTSSMAETIAELREELEAIDVNGIYSDRMQARLEAEKAQVEVTQLKAILAEKNREIEGLRYKEAK